MPWLFYAIPLGFMGLIGAAAIYKYMQVREAANWPSVAGKVVVSTSEVRTIKIADSDRESGTREEERNFAKIVYEYEVKGAKLRNDRVSIGEDLGNFQVAETVAKYPVGAVVIVYFDPRHPNTAVLERDLPQGFFGCLAWIVVIGVGLMVAGTYGFETLGEYISVMSAKPDHVKAALAFGGFGALVALFALAMHRMAAKARTWPVVQGRIVESDVEEFREDSDDSSRRGSLMYRARIAYAYRYNGLDYRSGSASMGGAFTSNMPGMAKNALAKFPLNKTVKVYVNPDNPSQATLSPRANMVWILWIVALALWGVAYYAWQQ